MLEVVQGMLPVVNVFFELGREDVSTAVHGLRAFQLADLARQARLSTPQQVIECLDVLTAALRRVRGDGEALFYLLDDHGQCAAYCMCGRPSWRSVRCTCRPRYRIRRQSQRPPSRTSGGDAVRRSIVMACRDASASGYPRISRSNPAPPASSTTSAVISS